MAFGVGLDLDFIRHVIHMGVPYKMEEYFQEAGRAGRDGLPSKAHVFYNAYDISKARKQLSPFMRKYVSESDKCKRDMILEYFGFSSFPRNSDDLHNCCDYHEKFCTCEDCLLSSMQLVMNPSSHKESPQASDEEMPTRLNLTAEQKSKLYEKLVKFRLSQSGHGRTSVGTTSLSSGITIEMINEFYEKAHTFSSVEDIEERLPVFSLNHAVAFWNALQESLSEDF